MTVDERLLCFELWSFLLGGIKNSLTRRIFDEPPLIRESSQSQSLITKLISANTQANDSSLLSNMKAGKETFGHSDCRNRYKW